MQVEFRKYLNERNALSKTFGASVETKTGRLRDACSIVSPVIDFEGDLPLDKNYMYIASFGRFYFIDNVISLTRKSYTVYGSVDVLQSFATYIRPCIGVVSRNESDYELTLGDSRYISYANPVVTQIPFTVSFPERQFILTVAGAQESASSDSPVVQHVDFGDVFTATVSVPSSTGYSDLHLAAPMGTGLYYISATPTSPGSPTSMTVQLWDSVSNSAVGQVGFTPSGLNQSLLVEASGNWDTLRCLSANDAFTSQGLAGLYSNLTVSGVDITPA